MNNVVTCLFVGVFLGTCLAVIIIAARVWVFDRRNTKAIKRRNDRHHEQIAAYQSNNELLASICEDYVEPFDICPLWTPNDGCDSSCPTCQGTGVMYITIDPL
jgi:hypothetical protein